jgi:thiol-disulfide isomerase/thioredoxin
MARSDIRWLAPRAAALLLLLAAGCSGADASAPEQPPERPSAARLGRDAPAYRTVTLEGDTVALDALRGSVVLLNAWAIWCPPCIEEMPVLRDMHRRYGSEGLVVVGLHSGTEGLGRARTFLRLFDIDYPNAAERWDRADALLGVQQGLPRSVLIDRQGLVVRRWIGPMKFEQEMIEAVLEDRHEISADGILRWRPRG